MGIKFQILTCSSELSLQSGDRVTMAVAASTPKLPNSYFIKGATACSQEAARLRPHSDGRVRIRHVAKGMAYEAESAREGRDL
jgi:hypothetical protein